MNDATITKALQEVRDRIAGAEAKRVELERTIAIDREEERLLLQIIELRKGPFQTGHEDATNAGELCAQSITTSVQPVHQERDRHHVVQSVVAELAAAGRPVHISDLMRLLRDANIEVPGKGTQANLIAHLRRDARIVRPSRGMYGLAAWGLENMTVTSSQKRIRKRVRPTGVAERIGE